MRPVHRLQEEMSKVEIDELLRPCPFLRENELQFVPAAENQFRPGFRAHTDPVDAGWRELGSVRLNRNLKTILMQGRDKSRVELQKRFTASADNEWLFSGP